MIFLSTFHTLFQLLCSTEKTITTIQENEGKIATGGEEEEWRSDSDDDDDDNAGQSTASAAASPSKPSVALRKVDSFSTAEMLIVSD